MTHRSQPIIVRGVLYPDAKTAARILDVSTTAIRTARSKGALDSLGIRRQRPVAHHNTVYSSILEAAQATGHSDQWIRARAAKGYFGWRFLPFNKYPEDDHA